MLDRLLQQVDELTPDEFAEFLSRLRRNYPEAFAPAPAPDPQANTTGVYNLSDVTNRIRRTP